eukprot:scaffold124446_cov61-Phaeocystis_antarctica.AAC.7
MTGPLTLVYASHGATRIEQACVQHQPSPSPVRDAGHARAWWADIKLVFRAAAMMGQRPKGKRKGLSS